MTRFVDDKLEYPKVIFDEMIKGPVNDNELARTIHEGTKVLSAKVIDDILVLDFSKEVLGYGGGSIAELGLVLSLEHAAKQIQGIKQLQILVESEKLKYLPEGTGVEVPIPLTPFVNNYDPSKDDTKVEMYLILKNSQFLVPTAISASEASDIAKKLKDPETYGGLFDDCLLAVNFNITEVMNEKSLIVYLDDTLLELPSGKREIAVKSIVYSIYSFIETRQDYDSYKVKYEGEEIVTLLNVDLTKEGVADGISLINKEGEI